MCELVFKIQEYIPGSKIDGMVVTKVLALLETKLTGFEINLREIMVDLTAVKGAAVAQKAELLNLS